MKVYGIPTCETVKKALAALKAAGKSPEFRDVRAEPLDEATLKRFLDAFGERLVNRGSMTWRNLPDEERAKAPKVLLKMHPTLMKRPVIEDGAVLTLGWTKDVQATHLN